MPTQNVGMVPLFGPLSPTNLRSVPAGEGRFGFNLLVLPFTFLLKRGVSHAALQEIREE
jgi:hypothetical protein